MVETRAFIGTPIVNRPIKELHEHMPDIKMRIVSLYRNDKAIPAISDTVIREGDHVYFLAKKNHISRALKEFRRAENTYQKIFIAGGGSIGLNVAKLLEDTHNIRIVELNEARAISLAEELNNTLVLQGSASDEDLLKEEVLKIPIYF